jgi:hypothetical protein
MTTNYPVMTGQREASYVPISNERATLQLVITAAQGEDSTPVIKIVKK